MPDAVASQTLMDGHRKAVMKFTNTSDGTGESAVAKVDVSELAGAPARVRIDKVHFLTQGMSVQLLWDATTDVVALIIPEGQVGCMDFTGFGGLQNNAGSGVTGDILFTTVGHTANDHYTVILEMSKA